MGLEPLGDHFLLVSGGIFTMSFMSIDHAFDNNK